jgi:hypothetical protein
MTKKKNHGKGKIAVAAIAIILILAYLYFYTNIFSNLGALGSQTNPYGAYPPLTFKGVGYYGTSSCSIMTPGKPCPNTTSETYITSQTQLSTTRFVYLT